MIRFHHLLINHAALIKYHKIRKYKIIVQFFWSYIYIYIYHISHYYSLKSRRKDDMLNPIPGNWLSNHSFSCLFKNKHKCEGARNIFDRVRLLSVLAFKTYCLIIWFVTPSVFIPLSLSWPLEIVCESLLVTLLTRDAR